MQVDLQKLKMVITEEELSDLEVLESAETACMESYQKEKTKKLLQDWTAAKTEKSRMVAQLAQKYFEAPPAFKNRKDAHDYIVENGYKCKKSKFYKDFELGRIRMQPDGSVLESEVKAYMATLKKVRSGSDPELKGLHIEKAKAELKKIQTAEEKLRFELEKERGLWLRREDVEREFIGKWLAIFGSIEYLVTVYAEDLISKVGGKPEKKQLFIDLFLGHLDDLRAALCDVDELKISIS